MSVTVSLREIVDHLNMISDESSAYLNKLTGELVLVSAEELSAAKEQEDLDDYPEWQRGSIKMAREVQDSEDYQKLPSKFDIHEYRIMEEFCHSVEPQGLRNQLVAQIKGSGAFGRFKQAIYSLGIEKDWYQFRDAEYERVAIEWLEETGIAYHMDLGEGRRRSEQAAGSDSPR